MSSLDDVNSGEGSMTTEPPARYPADIARMVTTRGGTTVSLRPIRPEDASRLVDFHERLSAQSVYRRFFSVHPQLSAAEVERFTRVDYVDRLAIIAEVGDRLIAVGRYDRSPGATEAEVAFVVADQSQHDGIATFLLELLADAAWVNGITTFTAQTMADNQEMMGVFVHSGFQVKSTLERGIIDVRFPIDPDDGYRAARSARHTPIEDLAHQRDTPTRC